MNSGFVWWGISAAVLIVAAAWIGRRAPKANILGIFLDSRGRFSLSQFQIVLWTIVVLSLLAGVFFARLFAGVPKPLDVKIPNELLIVMGISTGSAATAGAIKASKDIRDVTIIDSAKPPTFAQVYLVEEGTQSAVVDPTKFQNFWLTLIAIVAYVAMAVAHIAAKTAVADLNSLPGFEGTLVTLLGISHAGYLAGKLPDKK